MDHPWRPPPPILPGTNTNTNICPICSISHFPFCPPPPFIENPRFHYPQPPIDHYHHHRPPFDHHHPPFPNNNNNNNNNYYSNPSDGTWYGSNPSLNMTPYGDHNNNNNHYPRGGIPSATYAYDGNDIGGIKRMRIDNNNNNRGPRGPLMGGGENERILKLIHDHGNVVNATPVTGLFLEPNGGDIGLKRRREADEILSMGMGLSFERNGPYYDRRNELPHASGYPSQHRPVDVGNDNSQPPYYWSESKASSFGTNLEVHHGYGGQPPLPASPPPPLPRSNFFEPRASSLPPKKPSLFPVAVGSSAGSSSGCSAVLENKPAAPVYYADNASRHASSVSPAEEFHIRPSSSEKHARDIQPFPVNHLSSERQTIIDASHIFKQPHRASRPDHFVIILRGLPGSGKSYLAKMLRDIEVENGGEAPRIHSMDEYFMIEVEKAEDGELSKSGSLRGKRQVTKTVMEYCYEPEMEEAYRSSMLKAFKKTLDEGVYSFIIVDDRNLRVADFAQFWATAKRSGYEVYLVEASYKDPAGCAARNVHNFALLDIQKMAGQWEEAPPLYLKMDIKSLLHGDGLVESSIQEVDMDMEDEDTTEASQEFDVKNPHNETKDQVDDFSPHDDLKDVTVTNYQTEEVKDLSRSKWSSDFDTEVEEGGNKKDGGGALIGLVQAYSSKEAKSVCWGDQGGNVGFSISATRKTNTRSLVIGPGPGYNLKSNPLSEEESLKPVRNAVEPRARNVFQEQIRAERESFKAVFDKRRQRIGGFNMDEE